MGANFYDERKLSRPAPTVVVGWHPAFCLVRIGPEKIENATAQFSRISLQIIEEVDAEPVRMNMTFPARDDRARIRTQEQPSPEQMPIDFVDIRYVERFDLVILHFHGQVRPQSLY